MPQLQDILVQKVDGFIRRYYRNELIRGALLAISASLMLLFGLSLLEYMGRFESSVRTFLFTGYSLGMLSLFIWFVIRPLTAVLRLRSSMDRNQAARIIGAHFPEVSDKLLNALQLQQELDQGDNALLIAAIEQKNDELSPVPFQHAIDLKKTARLFRYGLLPALGLLALLLVIPGFKQSTERVINYQQEFEIPAPFDFVVASPLIGQQHRELPVSLKLVGSEIPREAFIVIDGIEYQMAASGNGSFDFDIPGRADNTQLHFEAGGYRSKSHEMEVLQKPSLISYDAVVTFPSYLKKASQKLNASGNLSIPEGSRISWQFRTRAVESLFIEPEDSQLVSNGQRFEFEKRFLRSQQLKVRTANADMLRGDSLLYNVQVIKDQFPQIDLRVKEDSLQTDLLYLMGEIRDDHGFTKLELSYSLTRADESTPVEMRRIIPIEPEIAAQPYFLSWDLKELGLRASDVLKYRVRVWDNDGVNGAKSTSSIHFEFRIPSMDELEDENEEKNQEIKAELSEASNSHEELEDEIESVERMLTEKNRLDWNDKQRIEDMLQKQQNVLDKLEKSIEQNRQKNLKNEAYNPQNEEIRKKQEKLEELFEEVMDDEMKELMEKIRKLMEENKLDQLQEQMEQFSMKSEELNKELDRMLELFKELELEQKLMETIEKLQKMAAEQKKLADESRENRSDPEELKEKQESLENKLEELAEDFKQIEQKNNELDRPKKLDNPEQERQEAAQDMEDATEQLSKSKKQKAAESQDKAAEKLEEMAEQMQQQKDEAYKEQQVEDYNSLRQILENLIQLSFDQEDVQQAFKEHPNYSPKYVNLRKEQSRIKEDSRIIEDSLLALSKRVMAVEHFITEEISKLNNSLDKTIDYLGERKTSDAMVHQQLAMTSYNKLALMLSNSLEQMQQAMAEQQESEGSPKSNCQKPGQNKNPKEGQGKRNMNSIQQLQKELSEQLKKLQEGGKNGEKAGAKEFAQAAARQAAIRQKLREIEQQLKKEGKGKQLGDLQRTQDLMEEVEKDLYYKKLDHEVLEKLKRIEFKLNEHERAEKKQEQDDKRSSNEAQELKRTLPPEVEKYLKEKQFMMEHLQQLSPELRPYYKKQIQKYLDAQP